MAQQQGWTMQRLVSIGQAVGGLIGMMVAVISVVYGLRMNDARIEAESRARDLDLGAQLKAVSATVERVNGNLDDLHNKVDTAKDERHRLEVEMAKGGLR